MQRFCLAIVLAALALPAAARAARSASDEATQPREDQDVSTAPAALRPAVPAPLPPPLRRSERNDSPPRGSRYQSLLPGMFR